MEVYYLPALEARSPKLTGWQGQGTSESSRGGSSLLLLVPGGCRCPWLVAASAQRASASQNLPPSVSSPLPQIPLSFLL